MVKVSITSLLSSRIALNVYYQYDIEQPSCVLCSINTQNLLTIIMRMLGIELYLCAIYLFSVWKLELNGHDDVCFFLWDSLEYMYIENAHPCALFKGLSNQPGLPSRILTCTELKRHWRLSVVVSSLLYFFWILSFRVHVKLFYRIVSYHCCMFECVWGVKLCRVMRRRRLQVR